MSIMTAKPIKKRIDKKEVWIVEGRKQFAKYGLKGINIDDLSKKIGISRTSFYHFYKTKDKFLKEMVDFWVEDGTLRVVNAVKDIIDPKERLHRIFDLALHNYLNDQFLAQMRNAAKKDRYMRTILEQTEKLRIQAVEQVFIDFGYEKGIARDRALLVYLVYLGFLEHFKTKDYPEEAIRRVANATINSFFI